jgi:hypothetical protein
VVTPHPWQECRPALLALDGHDPNRTAVANRAMIQVWRRTTPEQRQQFHRLTCLNDIGAESQALMKWFREQMAFEEARLLN